MRWKSTLLPLVATIALLFLFTAPMQTHAANPGELVVNSSGTVSAGTSLTLPIYEANNTNIRMNVSGTPASASLTFTVRRGATTVSSWVVRSGETSWGSTSFAAGDQIEINNAGATSLTYDLKVYTRSNLPVIGDGLTDWSGLAIGTGISSETQFNVITGGLFRFALAASSGSFQLQVDNNAIRKTVAQGIALDPADSTYYLSAGTHTFHIIQNSAAPQTAWSVALTFVGGTDSLPTSESTGVLGGTFFSEEWIPIQISANQPVNIKIAATGNAANSLVFELYNGTTKAYTSASVFGGEVVWGNSTLLTDANALRIVTSNGNLSSLAYSVIISAPTPAQSPWAGIAFGAPAHASGGNSTILFPFPTSGLYRFNLSATSGRYQFLLNNQYLQKTVASSAPADFTAYVAAGTYPMTIVQDPAAASTNWNAEITLASETDDALPYSRASTSLGGLGNVFREEWLPIQLTTGRPVNIRVIATGAAADALQVELFNGSTLSYTANPIYGGETFWATAQLTAGQNLLHIIAKDGNTGAVGYTIEVSEIPSIPFAWDGVTQGNGKNSTITVRAPAVGAYTMVITTIDGSGIVLIDEAANTSPTIVQRLSSTTTTIRVPLNSGAHTFTFRQDPGAPKTTWHIELAVRELGPYIINLPLITK